MTKIALTLLGIVTLASSPFFLRAAGQTDPNKFVRTANYYLLSGAGLETPQALTILPKFDVLILPVEAQEYNRAFFAHARKTNPDIIILAYVVSTSWNDLYWNDPLHARMRAGIQNSWWLTNGAGARTSNWPGLTLLNIHSGWAEYLADFVSSQVLSTGLWDGVMYDDVGEGISNIGSVDVDQNSSPDAASAADALWRAGYLRIVSRTRANAGNTPIIITNGSSRAELAPYVNGRMFETFPTPWEGNWATNMRKYTEEERTISRTEVNIINGTTENTGNNLDYAKMRFGLTSTLMNGGYFGFDFGTGRHADLWYYDEYDAALGTPLTAPRERLTAANGTWKAGVWERDFQNGKVLLNSTATIQRVSLRGDYEHLRGTQDRRVNSGRIVSEVTLNPNDGIVLLRPLENVFDAPFVNGTFVRIYTQDGAVKRNGFFAFEEKAQGNERVILYDIDRDGARERIVGNNTYVRVYESDGSLMSTFAPYTERYALGIRIGVGDLNGDGIAEIVTGTGKGGGPHVRIFNARGVAVFPGFFAYNERFRGGVEIAVGDITGDGIDEIITGAGPGGGPHVRMFNGRGEPVRGGFFAFDARYAFGLRLAAGDVNGDGRDDIIIGGGRGGAPEVRIFSDVGTRLGGFFAGDKGAKTGADVSAADLDSDGTDEILTMNENVFGL